MTAIEALEERVDAHQHFWDPTRADYAWLSGSYAPIRRPFGPDDLRPELDATRIGRTILVQTRSSLEETHEFLHLATLTDFVAGVVGWVDLTAPDVADVIADLRTGPGGDRLAGIRHQVHDEPDPDWLARPDVRRGLRAVEEADLVYDLLLRPREMPAGLAVARALPTLRFVIDHLAKPPIATGQLEPWAGLLAPFAGLPNVCCKLSGMVTEARLDAWRVGDLRPFADHAIRVFGPERLMFGSDWPVCLVAATYPQVVETASVLMEGLGDDAGRHVFGATARRVYRLPDALVNP